MGQGGNDGAFRIESPDVHVAALGMRNGEHGVFCMAPRVIVEDVAIAAVDTGVFFYTNSSGGQLLGSQVDMVSQGAFSLGADDLVVAETVFRQTSVAADLTGDRIQVAGNRIEIGAIEVEGDDALVRQNTMRNHDRGIRVLGARPRIEGNRLDEMGRGIVVACPIPGDPAPPADACTGGRVTGNTIVDTLDEAILVLAGDPGLLVEGNTVRRSGLSVTLNGEAVTARDNGVSDSGRQSDVACIELAGTDHVARSNSVARCGGVGIFLDGERIRAEENRVVSGLSDGIHVNGINVGPPFEDNAVVGNTVTENVGQGIVVWMAQDTTVIGNTSLHNRVDFCDAGFGTVVSGNHLTTTGACFE
jgi:parallel beta-helix repeat protein